MPSQVYKTSSGKKVVGDYIVGDTLGEGTYGKVKQGIHILSRKKVALKFIKMDIADSKYMKREIEIMKLLDHPHIVQLLEVLQFDDGETVLVMELVRGGELFDYILEKEKLTEKEAAKFMRQILSALKYCHERFVIHRDLKPENILLDENRNIKITDFGVSNVMRPGIRLQSHCGSPMYSSPELLLDRAYIGPEVDIWALGCILYAMVTGCMPWSGSTLSEQLDNAAIGNFHRPRGITLECLQLISRMLTPDPKKRATIAELYLHPWVNKGASVPLSSSLTMHSPLPKEEIDTEILDQLAKLGFDKEEVVASLQASLITSNCVGLYYLMQKKKKRESKEVLASHSMPEYPQPQEEKPQQESTPNTPQSRPRSQSDASGLSPPQKPDEQKKDEAPASSGPSRNSGFLPNIFKTTRRRLSLSIMDVQDLNGHHPPPQDQDKNVDEIIVRKVKLSETTRFIQKSTREIITHLEEMLHKNEISFKKNLKKGLVYSCRDQAGKIKFELEICEPEIAPGIRIVQHKRKKGDFPGYKDVINKLELDVL